MLEDGKDRRFSADFPGALAKVIEKETARCTEIIGNLLKFARQERAEKAAIDVNEVVGEDSYRCARSRSA